MVVVSIVNIAVIEEVMNVELIVVELVSVDGVNINVVDKELVVVTGVELAIGDDSYELEVAAVDVVDISHCVTTDVVTA